MKYQPTTHDQQLRGAVINLSSLVVEFGVAENETAKHGPIRGEERAQDRQRIDRHFTVRQVQCRQSGVLEV